jgi:hypothetical protein
MDGMNIGIIVNQFAIAMLRKDKRPRVFIITEVAVEECPNIMDSTETASKEEAFQVASDAGFPEEVLKQFGALRVLDN